MPYSCQTKSSILVEREAIHGIDIIGTGASGGFQEKYKREGIDEQ